jgi:Uma2 family endonuclease
MAIQEKRYKVDEFWQIANRPENQNKRLELIDGRIVEVSPSFLPSTIAGLIITAFNIYLRTNPIG